MGLGTPRRTPGLRQSLVLASVVLGSGNASGKDVVLPSGNLELTAAILNLCTVPLK